MTQKHLWHKLWCHTNGVYNIVPQSDFVNNMQGNQVELFLVHRAVHPSFKIWPGHGLNFFTTLGLNIKNDRTACFKLCLKHNIVIQLYYYLIIIYHIVLNSDRGKFWWIWTLHWQRNFDCLSSRTYKCCNDFDRLNFDCLTGIC